MNIETDPIKVKELAREKEAENWGFRSFIKECQIPRKKIDKFVVKFYKIVSGQIDCRACGNCCKEIAPKVLEEDVVKLAEALNLKTAEVQEEYLKKNEDDKDEFTFKECPCPFLESDNNCRVYGARPQDCRSYPHLGKKEFSHRLINVIKNSELCPIVYNVYEMLKEEIWGMDDGDDFEDELDDWG